MFQTWTKRSFLGLAITCCLTLTAAADFTDNGDFETGDTSGWVSFPTANSTFDITMDANSGSFAGTVFNDDSASSAVVKQANVGVGVVNPGDLIDIKFSAKGEGVAGGVVFAEFFSELSGGGVSSSEILGGAPLALTDQYQDFVFQAVAGSDVSGGITLQFAVVTGADAGSTSSLFVDDVSISQSVPEPSSAALLAIGGLFGLMRRRSR